MTTTKEAPLSESDARQIAWEFRSKFRNAEAFELAWNALFELKTAITPHLARRFLVEELLKYRAHLAGLEEPPPDPPPAHPSRHETYRCPGCERDLPQWSRAGHAPGCRHLDCYELEVRFREIKLRKPPEKRAESVPEPAPVLT